MGTLEQLRLGNVPASLGGVGDDKVTALQKARIEQQMRSLDALFHAARDEEVRRRIQERRLELTHKLDGMDAIKAAAPARCIANFGQGAHVPEVADLDKVLVEDGTKWTL